MNKKFWKTRLVTTVAMGLSLSVSTVFAPRPAQADTLTALAVGGGLIVLGLAINSAPTSYMVGQDASSPVVGQNTSVIQSVVYPSAWATLTGSMDKAAIVYSSVPPMTFQGSLAPSTGLETQPQVGIKSTERSLGTVGTTSFAPITPQAVTPMGDITGPDRVVSFQQTS